MPTPLLRLRCAIVGQRSVFTVDVDPEKMVAFISDDIASTRKLSVHGHHLRLYLAQPLNDPHRAWLKTTDEDYEALVGKSLKLTMLDGLCRAKDASCSCRTVGPESDIPPDEHVQTIHVLVKCPSAAELARYRAMIRSLGVDKKMETATSAPSSYTAESLYQWATIPLCDTLASLATWIVAPGSAEGATTTAIEASPKTNDA